MKIFELHSIDQFWQENKAKIDPQDIIISDIDGVWFDGFFVLREIMSILRPSRLALIKEITATHKLLLFTNRGWLGTWPGGYISQLNSLISDLKVFDSSTSALKQIEQQKSVFPISNLALIKNAQKPHKPSYEVLAHLAKQFGKIHYVAGQDFFWYYDDLDLLKYFERLEAKLNKDRKTKKVGEIYFYNIKK